MKKHWLRAVYVYLAPNKLCLNFFPFGVADENNEKICMAKMANI